MSTLTADPVIRRLTPADRDRVEGMTRAVALFWDYEIPIALEVFGDATGANVSGVADPDYETAGVEADGLLVGWAVWGPRPSEPSTFDLYWIVVDPAHRGHGLGTTLLDEMDRQIRGRVTRLVVETSGRADYLPTRRFYQRRGFLQTELIPDHYAPGDDQVVYEKGY